MNHITKEIIWFLFILFFYYFNVWDVVVSLFLVSCFIGENVKIYKRLRVSYETIIYEGLFLLLTIANMNYFYDLTMTILFINSTIRFFEQLFLLFDIFKNKELRFLIIEYFVSTYIFYKFYKFKIIPIVLCGVVMRHLLHTGNINKKTFLKKIVGVYYTLAYYNLCLITIYLFDN